MTSKNSASSMAEAAASPVVLTALWAFCAASQTSLEKLFNTTDGIPDLGELPQWLTDDLGQGVRDLRTQWAPAGLDPSIALNSVLDALELAVRNALRTGRALTVHVMPESIATQAFKAALGAHAVADALPDLRLRVQQTTDAVAAAQQELDAAIKAGDSETARGLRDRALGELPHAAQLARIELVTTEHAQAEMRAQQTAALVENLAGEQTEAEEAIEAARAAVEAATSWSQGARNRAVVARSLAGSARRAADEAAARAAVETGRPLVDPDEQSRAFRAAQVRTELGLPAGA